MSSSKVVDFTHEPRANYDTREMESRLVEHLIYAGPQTYHEIAEYYGLPYETTSKVIRKLLEEGLLTKTSDGMVELSGFAAQDYMAAADEKYDATVEWLHWALHAYQCGDGKPIGVDKIIYHTFAEIERLWNELPFDTAVPDIWTFAAMHWDRYRSQRLKNEAQK